MPPKARITKEMILDTVLDLTRKQGFESVNARSIAAQLRCSTQPIFTCYANMEEMKREFLTFAYAFYENYVQRYGQTFQGDPCLVLPLSYIAFAQQETHVFQLLFVHDMELDMAEAKDFYREAGNGTKAEAFAKALGLPVEQGRRVFLDLFFYAHGIAVLSAAGKVALQQETGEKMVASLLSALLLREKQGGEYGGRSLHH
ncbi:MAG TPA: TetR/AcrR family transcriptional regulator [Firmicutes bacterium]|nr:TetR/AcrR family transcriptional regulator [Bacillota bacterium]